MMAASRGYLEYRPMAMGLAGSVGIILNTGNDDGKPPTCQERRQRFCVAKMAATPGPFLIIPFRKSTKLAADRSLF